MGRQSELIKQLRGNLTQEEFAKIVGERREHVSRYENDRSGISLNKFLEWCEKLDKEIALKSC